MSLLPFLPHQLMDYDFGVQRKCFQVSTNVFSLMVFGKLGEFGVWCLFLYRQPEKQLMVDMAHTEVPASGRVIQHQDKKVQ